jgi:hypothetical protein
MAFSISGRIWRQQLTEWCLETQRKRLCMPFSSTGRRDRKWLCENKGDYYQ